MQTVPFLLLIKIRLTSVMTYFYIHGLLLFFCHDKVQASDGGCLILYGIMVIEEESD